MLPWQQEFKSNEPKYLINNVNPSLYLVMLYMKFDQNWPKSLCRYTSLKMWLNDLAY